MDEFFQENKNFDNNDKQNKENDEIIIKTQANANKEIVDEEIKKYDIDNTEQINSQVNDTQTQDNFFEEESYYDTHPLPKAVPMPRHDVFYPQNSQQYNPQNPYQQQQYNSQYQQTQYTQTQPINQPNYYSNPETLGNGAVAKKNKGPVIAVIIIFLLIAGLIAVFVAIGSSNDNFGNALDSFAQSESEQGKNAIEIPTQNKPENNSSRKTASGAYTTQEVARIVSPSVVGVVIYGSEQTLTPTGQASGIIISEDGYIITNAHVVEGAAAQKVVLSDGKEYVAEIIGVDAKTDLAVLKINEDVDIVPAEIGNSDELELGEQVIALGNPGGLSNSFSGGYVSGLNRQIKSSETGFAMNCIQTDAAVNPGNSGGPLVNMYGQVVGIVSSKYVATGFEGIGFAISINDALPIIQDISNQGYVSDRVKIGISFYGLDDTTAAAYEVVSGLYIREIDPDCDVANSGLAVNDIITEMNGQKVYDYTTTMTAIEGLKPGDVVTAKVYRKTIVGEETTFEISFKLMEDTSGDY